MREMDETAKDKLKAVNEAKKDWYATCRVCGKRLFGSLADLNKHWDECSGK